MVVLTPLLQEFQSNCRSVNGSSNTSAVLLLLNYDTTCKCVVAIVGCNNMKLLPGHRG